MWCFNIQFFSFAATNRNTNIRSIAVRMLVPPLNTDYSRWPYVSCPSPPCFKKLLLVQVVFIHLKAEKFDRNGFVGLS
jgi:hypothetical protein